VTFHLFPKPTRFHDLLAGQARKMVTAVTPLGEALHAVAELAGLLEEMGLKYA
jgi:hypothetical protein